MALFDVPDIRLFWSTDKRFVSQVRTPSCYRSDFDSFVNAVSKFPSDLPAVRASQVAL
jgi:hypothetical protein